MVVLAILGILLAIAVPSYLGYRDRGEQRTAQANLRSALPDVEAYYVDHQTYIGMTTGVLRGDYDQGISGEVSIDSADLSDTHYCLKAIDHTQTYWLRGPGGSITDSKPSGCT
jgi:Tfp pilus assembly protein PilE